MSTSILYYPKSPMRLSLASRGCISRHLFFQRLSLVGRYRKRSQQSADVRFGRPRASTGASLLSNESIRWQSGGGRYLCFATEGIFTTRNKEIWRRRLQVSAKQSWSMGSVTWEKRLRSNSDGRRTRGEEIRGTGEQTLQRHGDGPGTAAGCTIEQDRNVLPVKRITHHSQVWIGGETKTLQLS